MRSILCTSALSSEKRTREPCAIDTLYPMDWAVGLWVAALVTCLSLQAYGLENMNGEYSISNPNRGAKIQYSTRYADRGDGIRYFDVYSPPITTRYGEVYWTMMEDVPLPNEIIQKFANKTIAIVGYEVDQVKKNSPHDISVPIYDAYNHHYEIWLVGAGAKMQRVKSSGAMRSMMHNQEKVFATVQATSPCKSATSGEFCDPNLSNSFQPIPDSQWFSEGNGGEMRKSYHGYPKGTAQLIRSPQLFKIQPMQIDTFNRGFNGTGFKAGPLPKASAAPAGASYSGLLECPCTDRIKKATRTVYKIQSSGACAKAVHSAAECFAAGASISPKTVNTTVNSKNFPLGCSAHEGHGGDLVVAFNTYRKRDAVSCGAGRASSVYHGSTSTSIGVALTLDMVGDDVNITLSGPADVWFGVGFNAYSMGDEPYTIIASGNSAPMERKLGNHAPGTLLEPSIKVLSNKVSSDGKTRTIVMNRPMKGAGADYYSFTASSSDINLIVAYGTSQQFAFHKNMGSGAIALVATSKQSCICNDGTKGFIGQNNVLLPFGKNCLPEPQGDLIREKNPTCWLDTYEGGLACCHHQNILLDKDQNPWKDQTITYHMKTRFWYEEYEQQSKSGKPSHVNLPRMYYQTEAWAGEYDVVKCSGTTPAEDCVQEITAHWQVKSMSLGDHGEPYPSNATGIKLIYAGGHCHAPSCISLDLYNADTGDLLCSQKPTFGTGTKIFNEKGYIAIPPCLWGSEDEGLIEPVFLPTNANLTSVKLNNNTYSHYGEMASWQMRGVFVYDDDEY